MSRSLVLQTAFFTLLAMVAFASNAVMCRWAMDGGWIDPMSFTSLRLGSAAAMLFLVMLWVNKTQNSQQAPSTATQANAPSRGSWKAAFILFVYALTFSYGYVAISTANGALILSAVVQLTMIGYALRQGDKLHGLEWVGVALALMGLLYLVYPKLSTPSWWGLVMVVISAYTWALYSLNGRTSRNPLTDTAYNFYRTLPMIALASLLSLLFIEFVHLSVFGVALAVFSGAVTTGLGYILWYKALPKISSSLASATQLLVPLLAAFGAAWLISEPITLPFMLAAAMMVGGLSLVLLGRHQFRKRL
jgi:drug/metabolite transporter (DMT)-like permease